MNSELKQEKQGVTSEKMNKKGLMRFLIPSLFGVFIFLFPIYDGATFNIPLGIITEFVIDSLSGALPAIVTYVMVISAVFTVITVIFKPKFILHLKLFASLFDEIGRASCRERV